MKKFTLLKSNGIKRMMLLVSFFVFTLVSNKLSAQAYCSSELVYWNEDFGTGTTSTSNSNVRNLNHQPNGLFVNEGTYRIINNTQQLSNWHNSEDHTSGDIDGKMLVINGEAGIFYRKGVSRNLGYPAGFYSVSFFLMNVNTPGTCAPNPLLPNITIKAEYRNASNNWIELTNSPITTGPIPQTANPLWLKIGGVFTLPTTGSFLVNRIRFTLSNGTVGGCGNDFAIDDLKFASCPTGGPLPVQFLNVSARQKGSGVGIDWKTASEFNNKYFEVEKSTDGGLNWSVINTVPSKGNGSVTKSYNSYDAKPVNGLNYYRIRQIDNDGASKYSSTVVFKLNIDKTTASVLANPFNTNIIVDFLSTRNQVVNSRLIDMNGKLIQNQQFNIAKGSFRKIIEGVSQLNRGLYILQITDADGIIIYNDKLIKQ